MPGRPLVEAVMYALHTLGGGGYISDIYARVRNQGVTDVTDPNDYEDFVTNNISACLEKHSSDSEAFGGKHNLFCMARGWGEGYWALRDEFRTAEGPLYPTPKTAQWHKDLAVSLHNEPGGVDAWLEFFQEHYPSVLIRQGTDGSVSVDELAYLFKVIYPRADLGQTYYAMADGQLRNASDATVATHKAAYRVKKMIDEMPR